MATCETCGSAVSPFVAVAIALEKSATYLGAKDDSGCVSIADDLKKLASSLRELGPRYIPAPRDG